MARRLVSRRERRAACECTVMCGLALLALRVATRQRSCGGRPRAQGCVSRQALLPMRFACSWRANLSPPWTRRCRAEAGVAAWQSRCSRSRTSAPPPRSMAAATQARDDGAGWRVVVLSLLRAHPPAARGLQSSPPRLFGDVGISTSELPSLVELRAFLMAFLRATSRQGAPQAARQGGGTRGPLRPVRPLRGLWRGMRRADEP